MTQTPSNNMICNILIIDSDPQATRVLLETFASMNIKGTVATNENMALEYMRQNKWSLVFVSYCFAINQSQNSSYQFLRRIKKDYPELPVIMLSEINSAQNAVRALREGYSEFLVKPLSKESVGVILDNYTPNHQTHVMASGYSNCKCLYNIIGKSSEIKKTIDMARKVAPTSAPILLAGESGTGKELIAQLIHNESQRASAPFVKINCASLSDSLLESELFGHEKGAFTGASARHKGRFERAHGGTLLLDEITETNTKFQSNLLRVLEEMDFERVGGTKNINVNVRVISTTNTDILSEVHKGRFRADLYYRLAGIRLTISPLRDRKDDLDMLIWHFVNQFSYEVKRRITSIDPVMLSIFEGYHWPGNIRQLRNVIRTSLILGSGDTLSLDDVSWLIDELQSVRDAINPKIAEFAGVSLAELEEKAIIATLNQTDGNRTKAAKVLGISDRTLRDKVKKYQSQGHFQLTS